MLLSLHVKNFAIIDEIEVDFRENLNIITGETGAGKSIIIGSINAALGGKVPKDIIRRDAPFALIELCFSAETDAVRKKLEEEGLSLDEDEILVSRKIMANGRSILKVNGETVTAPTWREIAALLIDVHGQHEHQSLMSKAKHLEIVDRFAKEEIGDRKSLLHAAYEAYVRLKEEWDSAETDSAKRLREMSLLKFESDEITLAKLNEGEDELLEAQYRRLSNLKSITEAMGQVQRLIEIGEQPAGEQIDASIRLLLKVSEYDAEISGLAEQLQQTEDLLNDFIHGMNSYIENSEEDEGLFEQVEQRLDMINRLKAKYGGSISSIKKHCKDCEAKIERYQDYDLYLADTERALKAAESDLRKKCEELSDIRKNKAAELTGRMKEALHDLNFNQVVLEMAFSRNDRYSSNGFDDAEFMISLNPGQELQPLSKVASGGELSRIMLAIKSVLAEKDDIPTLIFDEIDTGISGRTAQMVSEKLVGIAAGHQVLCITHLPQIAAMADTHFSIEKEAAENSTSLLFKELDKKTAVLELVRLLGGAEITDSVMKNAEEMKKLADKRKKELRKGMKQPTRQNEKG